MTTMHLIHRPSLALGFGLGALAMAVVGAGIAAPIGVYIFERWIDRNGRPVKAKG